MQIRNTINTNHFSRSKFLIVRIFNPYKSMKQNKIYWVLILSLFVFSSCVEEFEPEFENQNSAMLVVDGEINQGTGQVQVTLSYSTNADQPVFNPATLFEVTVMDNLGNKIQLSHIGYGTYLDKNNEFLALEEREYKLHLKSLRNGKEYESSWERLPQAVEIDEIYTEFEYQEDEDVDHILEGIRFYLNTDEFNTDTTCFRWELTETYKYLAQYGLYFIYEGELESTTAFDSLYTCYKTQAVEERFNRGTSDLSENRLIGFPLNFVSTESDRLLQRYCLHVKQKVISRQANKFWNEVASITSNEATLFTTQPFQIQGNVKNIHDDSEIVLGYFEASAVSEKRIFVDKPLNLEFYNGESSCELITDEILPLLEGYSRISYPLYCTAIYQNGFMIMAFPVDQSCIDCTKKGGKINVPEFWID